MGVLAKDTGNKVNRVMAWCMWNSYFTPISCISIMYTIEKKKVVSNLRHIGKCANQLFLQRCFTAQETATIYYHSCFNEDNEMEFQETSKS